jgi:hypothetical protein
MGRGSVTCRRYVESRAAPRSFSLKMERGRDKDGPEAGGYLSSEYCTCCCVDFVFQLSLDQILFHLALTSICWGVDQDVRIVDAGRYLESYTYTPRSSSSSRFEGRYCTVLYMEDPGFGCAR